MPYTKADLIWEATRRNEDYKEYFNKTKSVETLHEIYLFGEPDIEGDRKRLMEGDESFIKMFFTGENQRWKVTKLVDPSVSISEIKEQIENGDNPHDVHPYYWMYHAEKKCVIKSDGGVNTKCDDSGNEVIIKGSEIFIPNKLNLTIDLQFARKDIKNNLDTILNDSINQFKEFIAEQDKVDNGYPVVHPDQKSINSCIKYLSIYDSIINEASILNPEENTYIEDGVKKYRHCDISELINHKGTEKQRESQRKTYPTAYSKSVQLIKYAPAILFSPPRLPQKSSETNKK